MMERIGTFSSQRSNHTIRTGSAERTVEIGRVFGGILPAGSTVSLEGGLGTGKTVFTKGVCAGLGVKDEVLSPTFILAEEYKGVFPVIHFDLYRLEKIQEVEEIGLFDSPDQGNVVLVEWGDRLPEGLLRFDLRVEFAIAGENLREIRINGPGNFIERLVEESGE